MKKQPTNKSTTKVGEINKLCQGNSNTIDTIYHIIGKFDLNGKIKVLNDLKTRGFKIAELLVVLLVLPFFRIRIDNMDKKQRGQKFSKAKKDAYYGLKNNEMIDWRSVQKAIVRQFIVLTQTGQQQTDKKITAFVADDTTAMKTGLKIEYVSKVHDHTTDRYLFGFKILVLGWFDGTTFVPVDFSIHREKGQGSHKERRKQKMEAKKLATIKQQYTCKEQELKSKKKQAKELKKSQKPTNNATNKGFQKIQKQIDRLVVRLKKRKNQVVSQEKKYRLAQAQYRQSLKQHPMCGLKPKERKEQFKKERIKNSPGYKRAQEVDNKKTDNLLKMLKCAIKSGIKAQYLIVDSWFFSSKMVKEVCLLLIGLHYMGMAPMRENIYYNYNGKLVNYKELFKVNRNKTHRCRKYRSNYIQIEVDYAENPLQLFFVKMGRAKKWKLLVTTDLNLDFIKIFELYQIRWSIEIFFKETKQYLELGKCQSQDFDAQICSTTLTLVRYILLCYYKRIHYQQKLDGIFEEISYLTMEASIVEKLIAQFIDLLSIVAEIVNVEPIELYMMLMQNPKAIKTIKQLKLENFMELK